MQINERLIKDPGREAGKRENAHVYYWTSLSLHTVITATDINIKSM